MAVVVGTASGHSFETASGNAAFDVILFGTVDAIHVLSRRRRLRLIASESVEDLSTGESYSALLTGAPIAVRGLRVCDASHTRGA
jgi:hypothetical protein